jgi:hypothetical protein
MRQKRSQPPQAVVGGALHGARAAAGQVCNGVDGQILEKPQHDGLALPGWQRTERLVERDAEVCCAVGVVGDGPGQLVGRSFAFPPPAPLFGRERADEYSACVRGMVLDPSLTPAQVIFSSVLCSKSSARCGSAHNAIANRRSPGVTSCAKWANSSSAVLMESFRSDRTIKMPPEHVEVVCPLRVPLTDTTHQLLDTRPTWLIVVLRWKLRGGLIGTGASLNVAVAGSLVLYRLAGLI